MFRTVQLAKEWARLLELTRPPKFVDNGVEIKGAKKTAQHYVNKVWLKDDDPPDKASLEAFLDSHPAKYESRQTLDRGAEGEVVRKLKALKSRRAPGIDTLTNDYLKSVALIIYPYVEHIFEACLQLSYMPRSFKTGKIVLIKKKDKDPAECQSPKGWRPIALLSCLGKVLEGLVAERLKILVTEHDIIPDTQYGVPRKTSTQAVERLLKPVYDGWCRRERWHSSIVKLDVKGAFNHVMGRRLLEVLARIGIPHWLILLIFDYLQSRSATVHAPKLHLQGAFDILNGVPQGSPLSSILFACFTDLLLKSMLRKTLQSDPGHNRLVLACVDDFYFLVTSPNFIENNRIIATIWKKIHDVGKENGIYFDKYGGMHFRYPNGRKTVEGQDSIPDIPGLRVPKVWKSGNEALEILGLEVDPQLQFKSHAAKIIREVNKEMHHIDSQFSSVKGPCFERMVHLFKTKILPKFTYGARCGIRLAKVFPLRRQSV